MANIIKNFLVECYEKRAIIGSLAKRNFRQQYLGSALGFVWAFIEPLLFISILYAVFTFGLKAAPTSDMPFSVYLISGIVAWLFFANTISGSSNSIAQYAYLVNNLGFRNSFLPIINIIGNLIPHTFFIILAVLLAWFIGFSPSFYTLQLLYYMFAMSFLLLGVSWITASTNLFLKDVSKIVAIIVQFGFWMTPIFWNLSMVPEKFQWIVKINPVYYVVRGYRESIVQQIPFWAHPMETLYFWMVSILILIIGIIIFNKLQPHFGDVV